LAKTDKDAEKYDLHGKNKAIENHKKIAEALSLPIDNLLCLGEDQFKRVKLFF